VPFVLKNTVLQRVPFSDGLQRADCVAILGLSAYGHGNSLALLLGDFCAFGITREKTSSLEGLLIGLLTLAWESGANSELPLMKGESLTP
jgi:hypothetical protein